jgi:hypothetical protein
MHQVNRSTRIAGTGSCVPSRVVTNAELAARVPTSDEWIVQNLGIRERRVIEKDQFTSDLATGAAKNALEMAGLQPNDFDLIIVATATPDSSARPPLALSNTGAKVPIVARPSTSTPPALASSTACRPEGSSSSAAFQDSGTAAGPSETLLCIFDVFETPRIAVTRPDRSDGR